MWFSRRAHTAEGIRVGRFSLYVWRVGERKREREWEGDRACKSTPLHPQHLYLTSHAKLWHFPLRCRPRKKNRPCVGGVFFLLILFFEKMWNPLKGRKKSMLCNILTCVLDQRPGEGHWPGMLIWYWHVWGSCTEMLLLTNNNTGWWSLVSGSKFIIIFFFF